MDAVSKYKPKQDNENKLKYYLNSSVCIKECNKIVRNGKFSR